MTANLSRRVVAEAIGTAFLLATVVGSGIMGERLAAGNVAITLLANSIATGAALTALILAFGPISGTFQSSGNYLLRGAARVDVERCRGLRRRSVQRRLRGCGRRESDVW